MAKFSGFTPLTPMADVVGPGLMVANPDEALLTPTTGTTLTDEQIKAFIDSGVPFGATDDGLEFEYAPDFEEDTYAGVPGNVRGGRKLTSAEISMGGSFTSITEENVKMFVPNMESEEWSVGAEGTETQIGNILTPRSYLLDADYIDSIATIGERKGTNLPIVVIIYNAMNAESFSLSLNGDETRSNTDVSFMASYGANTWDQATGTFRMPLRIYLPTPATPVLNP